MSLERKFLETQMLYENKIKELELELEEAKQKQVNYYQFGSNCKKVTITTIDGKTVDICNDKNYNTIKCLEEVRKEIEGNAHYFNIDAEFYIFVYNTISNKIKYLKDDEL